MTRRDKYIWFSQSGQEQYFELDKDPQERHDAIRDFHCQERVAYLRGLLAQELAGREEGYSDGVHLIPGCEPRECLANATLPNY